MNAIWQILVPCNYNDGKPVRTRHHREWDRQVRTITGGLTIFPPSKGQWVDQSDGKLYQDRVIPVNVICDEEQIERIADITIKHYKQLAVMYFKLSDSSHIRFAK
jgi:hypothetical protein